MPGFSSYDAVLDALSVAGKGQDYYFNKASITTVANTFWSLWTASGQPTTGTFGGTPLAARACTSSTTGALGFTNPTAPDTLHLLAFNGVSSVAAGTFLLVDRLLDYATISATSTSLQSMDNTVTLSRYTDGAGVQMFAEVQTAIGATPQVCTITYTSQSGTTGRTTSFTSVASAAANRMPYLSFFIPLAAGDTGVRKIESVQFGGSTGSGTIAFALVKPIVELPIQVASMMVERNTILSTPRLFQIVDNACLSFLLFAATTSSGTFNGRISAAAR
jgi:hypothetical protein